MKYFIPVLVLLTFAASMNAAPISIVGDTTNEHAAVHRRQNISGSAARNQGSASSIGGISETESKGASSANTFDAAGIKATGNRSKATGRSQTIGGFASQTSNNVDGFSWGKTDNRNKVGVVNSNTLTNL